MLSTPKFMLFASLIFIFWFLPVVIGLYFLIKPEYRNYWLILASLFFYTWGEASYVFFLLISITINYLFGLGIYKFREKSLSKLILVIALLFDFGSLIYFKYWEFILQNISKGFPSLNIPPSSIHLPIGISFFTFQIASYIIDVYRKKDKPLFNFFDLTLYICLFPHLIAGPIIRYHQIIHQFKNRVSNLDSFSSGIQRFCFGLAKKVLIANNVAVVADSIFNLPAGQIPANLAWLGIVAYSLQIYFDFSGYSDMALGLFKIFGFDFEENFNYPYISTSIQDFWRRWHISLSTWFREYVYIPLGGNRIGTFRIYLNLLIVFTLTGIWHGANWTFLVWGLFNGLFLVLERLFLGKALSSLPKMVGHIYTLLVVMVGWVFFRSEHIGDALQYIYSMFNFSNFQSSKYFLPSFINNEQLTFLILGLVFSLPIYPLIYNCYQKLQNSQSVKVFLASLFFNISFKIISLSLFGMSVYYLILGSYNPFIYFRF